MNDCGVVVYVLLGVVGDEGAKGDLEGAGDGEYPPDIPEDEDEDEGADGAEEPPLAPPLAPPPALLPPPFRSLGRTSDHSEMSKI